MHHVLRVVVKPAVLLLDPARVVAVASPVPIFVVLALRALERLLVEDENADPESGILLRN